MLRPLLKFMIFIFVTLTIVIFVIDSVHSMSTSHWTITSFDKILANLLQTDIYGLNQSLHNIMPTPLSSICIALICLPVWFIFGAIAIILCVLNHKKQKPFHKISYT
ncbi:hypothetical protein [Bartonella rattaustraliani]|uniref:hypothetical protein n=1 Tax=Bartonella rattaustraliani TaxID=481139 RepID=UPI00031F1FFA|nr:hypothetical protein [Bartonella rattaustraliani]